MLRDDRLLAVVSTTTEENYSSRIFRQLEFLLGEVSLTLVRFDVFAVSSGPGSFTGVRVGLTSAKAWAEAFGRPIVAVGAMEAIAAQAMDPGRLVVAATDARRGQIYTASFRGAPDAADDSAELVRASEDSVMSPAEFLALLSGSAELKDATLATPSASWLDSTLRPHAGGAPRLNIREVSPVLAPVIGKLAHRRALRGETIDALRLDANYVRRCDAELNWKDTGA